MGKLILLLIVTMSILSCAVKEKPIFKGIEDIKVVDSNSRLITLTATVLFENPNDLGGSLKSDAISIYVNDIKLAKLSSESFDVPERKEFTIPLKVDISTDSILKMRGTDAIGSLLNSLINKQIKVQYKGDLIYKTFGFSYTYPIDETEMVKLNY
ncbi:LEA type 2 family protein [Psychroserpens burtonensis]|uniref:LEA type 2 family protein n=1 Tax=Psychroserpens burtonensis TaxID=49278 RepID=A0A5C7B6H2_9FLAO|nr:LEA type 2 family protein [Psychroserpens burtonensis]TXE17434.1 LEA type 2 family protein [Psychroserpens burtonensis]